MRVAELFCGMGISALGHILAGHDVVYALDSNPRVVRAFNAQEVLPSVARVGLVGSPLPVEVDVLSGGPSCRAFSVGASLFGTKGASDPRNTFPACMRVIEAHRPRYVLLENAQNLQAFAGYVEELTSALERLGYTVRFGEIDCYDFGVAQHRARVVFLAHQGSRAWEVSLPKRRLHGPRTLGEVLAYPAPEGDPWPLLLPVTPKILAGRSTTIRKKSGREETRAELHRATELDEPSLTVTAHYGKLSYDGLVQSARGLMRAGPRVAARLQGLPDNYDLSTLSLTAALQAIGNGFPAQVVEWFMRRLP